MTADRCDDGRTAERADLADRRWPQSPGLMMFSLFMMGQVAGVSYRGESMAFAPRCHRRTRLPVRTEHDINNAGFDARILIERRSSACPPVLFLTGEHSPQSPLRCATEAAGRTACPSGLPMSADDRRKSRHQMNPATAFGFLGDQLNGHRGSTPTTKLNYFGPKVQNSVSTPPPQKRPVPHPYMGRAFAARHK